MFTCAPPPTHTLFAGIPVPLLVIPHYNLVEDNAAWWVGGPAGWGCPAREGALGMTALRLLEFN